MMSNNMRGWIFDSLGEEYARVYDLGDSYIRHLVMELHSLVSKGEEDLVPGFDLAIRKVLDLQICYEGYAESFDQDEYEGISKLLDGRQDEPSDSAWEQASKDHLECMLGVADLNDDELGRYIYFRTRYEGKGQD